MKNASQWIALVALAVTGALLVSGSFSSGADQSVRAEEATAARIQDVAVQRRLMPPQLEDTNTWLSLRRTEQLRTAGEFSVFNAFQFVDRIAESGITFRHRIVDDAGKTYKAAHYDHGNGVAIADVDGDALIDLY
ncbi:MAG TPA: hypothetical protein VH701_27915, partial [Vicinamibacterales bacterium]